MSLHEKCSKTSMGQPPAKMLSRLKMGISRLGILAFLAGAIWVWKLRDAWPRAAGDPVPRTLLEAVGLSISGIFLAGGGRQERKAKHS
jgi:hypothetical protein